jgi:CheY-like chemotaxis protein
MLISELQEEFEDVQVDGAACVEDALRLVEQAIESRRPYDVVLLDFKLPVRMGENDEVDESVCRQVRDSMLDAYILHYTGYGGDPVISRHMEQEHGRDRPDQARTRLVEKTADTTWVEELRDHVRSFLDGKRKRLARQRVAEGLDRLFGAPESGHPGAARARDLGRPGDRGISHELEALRHDIVTYWNDLDDQLKDRVGTIFRVEEGDEGVRVALR